MFYSDHHGDKLTMPTLPSSLQSTNTLRNSDTSSASSTNQRMKKMHSGEWLNETGSRNSEIYPSDTGPPPVPKKSRDLQYANLDHKAFMNDPRNQVLPPHNPPTTQYATIAHN